MRTVILSLALLLALVCQAHGKLLTADRISEPQALLPYCSWLADEEGAQTIDSVSSAAMLERFTPFSGHAPLQASGPVWMRLVIIKSMPSASLALPLREKNRLVINMGQLPSGRNEIFYSRPSGSVASEGVWHNEGISSHEEVLLPEPGLLPLTIFIRMENIPGLWFAPIVSAQGAQHPDMLPSELILPGLLIVAAAVCLLRAMAERAQWAFWSSLFLLAAIGQAVLPVPVPGNGLVFSDLPALLAPGMALVLLPHIGRCMFRTDKTSRVQDVFLYFCSFIGVAAALAPLAPGFGWLVRLFPLTPLLFLPLLPMCVGAMAAKRPGSLAFFGAAFMPLLGAGVALYALIGQPLYPLLTPLVYPLAAQGGLWGMAVGGLGLALARVPRAVAAEAGAQPEAEAGGLELDGDVDFAPQDRADAAMSGRAAAATGQAAELARAVPSSSPSVMAGATEEIPSAYPDDGAGGSQDTSDFYSTVGGGREPDGVLSGEGLDEPLRFVRIERFEKIADQGEPAGESSQESDSGALPDNTAPGEAAGDECHVEGRQAGGEAYTDVSTPVAPDFITEAKATAPTVEEVPLTFTRIQRFDKDESPECESGHASDSPTLPEAGDSFAVRNAREAARQPVDETPGMESFPASVSETDDADMADSISVLADTASNKVISFTDEEYAAYPLALMEELQEGPARHITLTPEGGYLFNLHSLVREVHDIVAPLAKTRGLIFSWYIAPSLPALLEGDAPRLRGALSLLLQNAVQASAQGAVQLAVRHTPGADEPGDLQFTITDSGSTQRTDAGFFHAWELAARSGGGFNVDYSPSGGTRICFSARFSQPSDEAAREYAAGVVPPVPPDTALEAWGASRDDEQANALAAAFDSDEPVPVLHTPTDTDTRDDAVSIPADESWLATVSPPQPSERWDDAGALSSGEERFAARDTMADEMITESMRMLKPGGGDVLQPLSANISEHLSGIMSEAGPGLDGDALAVDAVRDNISGVQAEPIIAAAEMTTSKRRLLAHYLGGLPYEHVNCASAQQLLDLVASQSVALVIFDGDMPEPDILKTMAGIRHRQREAGRPASPVLVLTSHQGQSERLLKVGASYALVKPFQEQELREVVARAVPSLAGAAAVRADLTDRTGVREMIAGNADATYVKSAAQTYDASVQAPSPGRNAVNLSTTAVGDAARETLARNDATEAVHAPRVTSVSESPLLDEFKSHYVPPAREVDILKEALRDVAATAARQPETGDSTEAPAVPVTESSSEMPHAVSLVTVNAAESATESDKTEEIPASATDGVPGVTSPDKPTTLEEETAQPRVSRPGAVRVTIPSRKPSRDVLPHPPSVSETEPETTALTEPSAVSTEAGAQPHDGETDSAPRNAAPVVRVKVQPRRAAGHAPGEAGDDAQRGRPGKGFTEDDSDVDLLSRALRGAPEPSGKQAIEVSLPPRFIERPEGGTDREAETSRERSEKPASFSVTVGAAASARAGGETLRTEKKITSAAPMVMGLSVDDITPPTNEPKHGPVMPSMEAPAAQATSPEPAASALSKEPAEGTGAAGSAMSSNVSAGSQGERVREDSVEVSTGLKTAEFSSQDTSAVAGFSDMADETSEPNVNAEAVPTPDAGETQPVVEPDAAAPATEDYCAGAEITGGDDEEPDVSAPAGNSQMYPLPGIDGETIDVSVLPLTPGIIHALGDILGDAEDAVAKQSGILMQDAMARLAGKAEHFGLHKLGKIARCVERAAEADDLEAVSTLFEDLAPITRRYMAALQECFQSFLNLDR